MKTISTIQNIIKMTLVGLTTVIVLNGYVTGQEYESKLNPVRTDNNNDYLAQHLFTNDPRPKEFLEFKNEELSHLKSMLSIVNKAGEVNDNKTLTIENWMSDSRYWNNVSNVTEDDEGQPKLESWMSDVNYWNVEEKPIQIEEWMIDPNYWSQKSVQEEKPLKIENWMSDVDYWKNSDNNLDSSLVIESWMTDTEYWNNQESSNSNKMENWMSDTNYWDNKL